MSPAASTANKSRPKAAGEPPRQIAFDFAAPPACLDAVRKNDISVSAHAALITLRCLRTAGHAMFEHYQVYREPSGAAWRAFYANDRGIRDELVRAWGTIAKAFRTEPAVAGYDLLNEPDTSRPSGDLAPNYEALLTDVIGEIRAARCSWNGQGIWFHDRAPNATDRPSRR